MFLETANTVAGRFLHWTQPPLAAMRQQRLCGGHVKTHGAEEGGEVTFAVSLWSLDSGAKCHHLPPVAMAR